MSEASNIKTAEIEKISHLEYFNIAVSVDCVIFGYESKELKTLSWIICDYVAHMEHHFRQIFSEQE